MSPLGSDDASASLKDGARANDAPPSIAGLHTLHAAAAGRERSHGTRLFTKYTLVDVLHIRAEEVQEWIDRGWLKCRIVQTGRLKKEIIDAADFCGFCKHHCVEIVGRRLCFLPVTWNCYPCEKPRKNKRSIKPR
jgi:hypothetical protein